MHIHLPAMILIMSLSLAKAQDVNIPDVVFKAALVNNPSINTNGDTEIQITEAAAYSSTLFVAGMGIYDLTGIETFTAINELYCSNNYLTSLDLSANTALYFLDCSFNQLSGLDVSANPGLGFLLCAFNQLTSLNISTNTNLSAIWCNSILLTGLDVSAIPNLGVLICRANQLTSLNLSSNTSIGSLICDSNKITSLDLSANIFLNELSCQNNQLTSLNVQNGYNINLTSFNATHNPDLTCIQVDSVAYSNDYWSAGKDATASFSTKCGITAVPGIDAAATLNLFPNPVSNHLTIALGDNYKKVEVTITDNAGKLIYNTIATNTQNVEVSTKDFVAGIYVVNIQTTDCITTRTFMVVK